MPEYEANPNPNPTPGQMADELEEIMGPEADDGRKRSQQIVTWAYYRIWPTIKALRELEERKQADPQTEMAKRVLHIDGTRNDLGLVAGEKEGFYYLIDLEHGDVLKCPGNAEVAREHLKMLRKEHAGLYPDSDRVPWWIGSYGPYPMTAGGEDDPSGFRSYGYVATLEGRINMPRAEWKRVRKPGGDRLTNQGEKSPDMRVLSEEELKSTMAKLLGVQGSQVIDVVPMSYLVTIETDKGNSVVTRYRQVQVS